MATSASRKEYQGGAVATTITGDITGSSTSISIADASGWPTGGVGNFWVAISRGETDEEKILCSSRTSTTLTVAGGGRGGDGTSAAAHSSGAAIEHVGVAEDFDEANELASLADAKGDIVAATAADAWERVAVGANGLPLIADSAQTPGVKWGELQTAGIGDSQVTTAKINDAAVTAAKIAAAVAGNGLAGGAGSALSVNVDGVTVEIAADTLQIKALGVDTAQLAAAAVTTAKIADDNVTLAKLDLATFQVIQIVTSATRPGTPAEGDTIYETDTDKVYVYDGANWVQVAALGAWDTYTPTLDNITLGNGTVSGRWTRRGRWISVLAQMTFGSTSAVGTGNKEMGLPVAPVSGFSATGMARYFDSSAGTWFFGPVFGRDDGTAKVHLLRHINGQDDAVNLGATSPFSWATGDKIQWSLEYEAAASA